MHGSTVTHPACFGEAVRSGWGWMCGLGTGSASLRQQQHFHYTFEERHWIIGNGSGSPESPSGHLPAHPAHSTCLRAPDGMAEPPGVANYPAAGATSLGSWVQGSRVCGPAGKQSSPRYMELGRARWALPACFARPWHKQRQPQNTSTGGLESHSLTLIPLRPHSISLSQPDFSHHSGIFWIASYYSPAH